MRRVLPKKRRRGQPKGASKKRDVHAKPVPGRWRIVVVASLTGLIALGVALRAGQLQIMQGAKYEGVADRQASISARITATRGVIKDRHGNELAITVDVDSVYAEPRIVREPRKVARSLAPVLGISRAKLLKKLTSGRAFVFLKRRVDANVARRVRALGFVGISTQPEPKRFYSNIGLAAHVLGFTGFDGQGRAGVERSMDADLRGKSYEVPGLKDALGNRVFSEGFVPHAVLEGADVYLTIDQQIQHATEEALEEAIVGNEAKAGAALVLEAATGEVLALASYPSFNPNNLNGTDAHHHLNRAVSAVYEPGSTMKIVTIASALEAGLIKAKDRIHCEDGIFEVGGRRIRDSDHAFGELSIFEIMKVSSNICAAKIGLALGAKAYHRWLFRFGFGATTGVRLPGELRGLIRPPNRWRAISLANVSFGQGLSVTPLQIAQAASVIANGGVLVRPTVVKATLSKSGKEERARPHEPVRVVSLKTAREVTEMMVGVTQDGGTAVGARIPGFRVAGKTGTAQKIDPVSKSYSKELYVASFVGFVPADKPEVLVLVLIDEPKRSVYGGAVAAPAFRKIAESALAARSIFGEDPAPRRRFSQGGARSVLKNKGIAAPPTPSARSLDVDSALSAEAQSLLGGHRSFWDTAPRAHPFPKKRRKMPNFLGLRLGEVLDQSQGLGCDPVLVGTGHVVSQKPKAGALLAAGSHCELTFAERG